MTTERIEQKEVKMELLAAPVIEDKTCKLGESSLKLQEVSTKASESKKKATDERKQNGVWKC